jgi:hypothetical protein
VFDCGLSDASYALESGLKQGLPAKEISMTKIKVGDKVIRNAATANQGKVCLGDCAPVFRPAIRAGDKVVRDTATANQGKVCLGDCAPIFRR